MKAALFERHGHAADVLRVTDVETPEPGPGEVRVRMKLSGINPTDWKSRSGATPRPIDGFQIPHFDGSGIVDTAVGPGSRQEPCRPAGLGLAGRRRAAVGYRRTVVSVAVSPGRAAARTACPTSLAPAWTCRR